MIEIIDDFGDLWRLHYACHGCPPVHFYDNIYGVVIESGEPPEFTGDMGTVNGKHKVDNLNLVWCITELNPDHFSSYAEEQAAAENRIRMELKLKESRITFEEGIRHELKLKESIML